MAIERRAALTGACYPDRIALTGQVLYGRGLNGKPLFNPEITIDIVSHQSRVMEPESESPEAMFQRSLHVSEALATALVKGGLTTLDEVAYVPHWELAEISGLNEQEVTELRNLARMYLLNDAFEGSSEAGN